MYIARYGLHQNPFNMTPDPGMLYLNARHREALAGLTYAILAQKGFIVLTGDAGTGKTTLLARVRQRLPPSRVQTSLILNPSLTTNEFLEMALLALGVTQPPESKAQRLFLLHDMLLKAQAENRIVVLIVDEAHTLRRDLLEEIRLLGNFECSDRKLLQIVLAGQTELADVLNREDMRQLKQRIAVRLRIEPLTASEVAEYVRFRWVQAGGAAFPFLIDAMAEVVRWSKGIPRLVNAICDNALLLSAAEDRLTVGAAQVREACMDLDLTGGPPRRRSPLEGGLPETFRGEGVAQAAATEKVNGTAAEIAGENTGKRAMSLEDPLMSLKTLQRYEGHNSKSLLSRCAGLLGFAH